MKARWPKQLGVQLGAAMLGTGLLVFLFVLGFGWISGLEWRPGPAELPWDAIGRAAIPAAALVIAAGGVVLAMHGQRTRLEELQATRDANVTERYTKAVEQLGHTNPSIRLGGLYALQRIANDSQADRKTIIKVISAHTRRALEEIALAHREANERANETGDDLDLADAHEVDRGWTVDLSNATSIVAGIRSQSRDDGRDARDTPAQGLLDLSGLKGRGLSLLTAPNLVRANLRLAELERSSLPQAKLFLANLSAANFTQADLSGADLGEANLHQARLDLAKLKGTYFAEAVLTSARLREANLWGAFFGHADLTDANLAGANLTGANLTGANLTGANLTGANLAGANFEGAKVSEAIFGDNTGVPRQLATD